MKLQEKLTKHMIGKIPIFRFGLSAKGLPGQSDN